MNAGQKYVPRRAASQHTVRKPICCEVQESNGDLLRLIVLMAVRFNWPINAYFKSQFNVIYGVLQSRKSLTLWGL
jgi:hypothetical protein